MKRFLWVFLVAILFLAGLGGFLSYQYRLRNNFNQTRQQLMLIASNAALSLDAQEILKVPLKERNEDTPEYQVVFDKLVKIKQANPSIKYVYIMTTTDQPGILQYVVDADPLPKIVTAKSPTAFPEISMMPVTTRR